MGQVEADLNGVPKSAFTIEGTKYGGQKILHAPISIVMSVASADLKFEVMFEGECYGKTRIEYHHDGLSDTPIP